MYNFKTQIKFIFVAHFPECI